MAFDTGVRKAPWWQEQHAQSSEVGSAVLVALNRQCSVSDGETCGWLNVISPLLPSCWGFFAPGHGVSPQSHSSTAQPLLQLNYQCIFKIP